MYPDARRTLHVCPESLHVVESRALFGIPCIHGYFPAGRGLHPLQNPFPLSLTNNLTSQSWKLQKSSMYGIVLHNPIL